MKKNRIIAALAAAALVASLAGCAKQPGPDTPDEHYEQKPELQTLLDSAFPDGKHMRCYFEMTASASYVTNGEDGMPAGTEISAETKLSGTGYRDAVTAGVDGTATADLAGFRGQTPFGAWAEKDPNSGEAAGWTYDRESDQYVDADPEEILGMLPWKDGLEDASMMSGDDGNYIVTAGYAGLDATITFNDDWDPTEIRMTLPSDESDPAELSVTLTGITYEDGAVEIPAEVRSGEALGNGTGNDGSNGIEVETSGANGEYGPGQVWFSSENGLELEGYVREDGSGYDRLYVKASNRTAGDAAASIAYEIRDAGGALLKSGNIGLEIERQSYSVGAAWIDRSGNAPATITLKSATSEPGKPLAGSSVAVRHAFDQENMTVTGTVANTGDAAVTDISVQFVLYDADGGILYWSEKPVPGTLAPGEEKAFDAYLDYHGTHDGAALYAAAHASE